MRIYVCNHCGKVTDKVCWYGQVSEKGIKQHDLCPDCYNKLIDIERHKRKQWETFVEKYLNATNNPKQTDTDDLLAEYIRKYGVQ